MRALGVGTTGVPLPFTLDPSIILSGTGVANPIRSIARVETISTNTWRGVSSDGVVAAFAAEATEASDNSPTLVQPVLTTAKAQCFVPYSIEVGQDWATLEHELTRLFTDAKNVLEATQFLTGTGSNAPGGILNIGGTGGLTTTQRVQTTTTAVYALGDPWLLKAAVPPRVLGNTTFVANPGIWDLTYRFVGGNSTEPLQFDAGARGGAFLGRPKTELSTMVATTTTASRIMIAGDWSNYLIADRIGGTVEIVPLLMGAANRFPTGQRGAYYYFRVAAGCLAPNAFRYLEVK
jgi:HK97 family phage major capsid protein